jgi:hypothetical protein
MATLAQHAAEQDELKGEIPYEVRVEQRILDKVRKEPGVSLDTLKHRVGFVITPVYDSVLARLIETGALKQVAKKVGFVVAESAAQ